MGWIGTVRFAGARLRLKVSRRQRMKTLEFCPVVFAKSTHNGGSSHDPNHPLVADALECLHLGSQFFRWSRKMYCLSMVCGSKRTRTRDPSGKADSVHGELASQSSFEVGCRPNAADAAHLSIVAQTWISEPTRPNTTPWQQLITERHPL